MLNHVQQKNLLGENLNDLVSNLHIPINKTAYSLSISLTFSPCAAKSTGVAATGFEEIESRRAEASASCSTVTTAI
jgi:hypothetical protein